MRTFTWITDAELHAAATSRWASPQVRSMQAASVVTTGLEIEHAVSATSNVKYDLKTITLIINVPIPLEDAQQCPTLQYCCGIIKDVHGFSQPAFKKNGPGGTELRFTTTPILMDKKFSSLRLNAQIKTFFQSGTIALVAFFLFLLIHGCLYGWEESGGQGLLDDDDHDSWDFDDEID